MNLETELRTAMDEHVRGVTAAPGLVDEVRRRHRRRTLRNRALTGAAVATAVAAATPFLLLEGPGAEDDPPSSQPALASPSETAPPSVGKQISPAEGRLCPPGSQPRAGSTNAGKPKKGIDAQPMGPRITAIEGVDVRYLPAQIADLPTEQAGSDPSTNSWGYGIEWTDAKSDRDSNATSVSMMVLCGPAARGAGLLQGLVGWQPTAEERVIHGGLGRYEKAHAAWMVRPGVAIDVQVSKNVDLDKVVHGIKVTG